MPSAAGLPGTASAERVTRWPAQPEVEVLLPEVGVSWRLSWRRLAGTEGAVAAQGGAAALELRERPGCGRSGAVREPGWREWTPWRGRAGPGPASPQTLLSPLAACFQQEHHPGHSRERAGRRVDVASSGEDLLSRSA